MHNTTTSSPSSPQHHDEPQSIIQTYHTTYDMSNGCFRLLFCLRRRRRAIMDDDDDDDDEEGYLLPGNRSVACDHEIWLVRGLRKVREVSEIMAGPKWKNFVRRIGAYFRTKRRVRMMRRKNSVVRYDVIEYKMNFDDGVVQDDLEEEEDRMRFSIRYAPAVVRDHHVQRAIPVS